MNTQEQKADHALQLLAHLHEVQTGGYSSKSRELEAGEHKMQEAAESYLYYYFQVRPAPKRKRHKKSLADERSRHKKAPNPKGLGA